MNEKFCYGCMRIYDGELCSCGWKDDYSQEEADNLLKPGTLLNGGNYMIGRRLGRGGFGVTYIGLQQNELGLKVAVKEYYPRKIAYRSMRTQDCGLSRGDKMSCDLSPYFKPGMTNFDRQNLEQKYESGKKGFIEEAKRLVELNELSTIVRVLGYFEENNTAYIVMEYIDGIDLYQYIQKRGKTMRLEEVKEYIYPIIRDLEQVHQKGIIHRDISPDNIMVTKSGNVKLIDFGASITKETEEEVKILRKNGFAPLEQYDASGNGLGAWTDVYAMCATIYYLISGKMIPDARDRQFFDRYETLRKKNIIVPVRLDKILKKGLAIDSHKRYGSMKELLRQLKKVHGGKRIYSWAASAALFSIALFGMLAGYREFTGRSWEPNNAAQAAFSGNVYLEELDKQADMKQTDSASNYAVYGDLVYIRYTFGDGVVMLVRSPIGTDDFSNVEYVTDGAFERFCVDGDYLYFTMMEDKQLYRVNIGNIENLPDESQRIQIWEADGKLEKVSSYALDAEYGFTVAEGYVFSVIHSGDGRGYEILRAQADGSESYITDMHIEMTNCIFYDGRIYMTMKEGMETVLSRMRMDGSYFEELARYSGEIPAMKIVSGEIYYLFNSSNAEEESYLGRIRVNGSRDTKLSVRTDDEMQYCYMTGVVDGNSIYYTCSVKGTEEVNSLYCYSLENGSNKQISSECGRYIVTSDDIDYIIFASMDGSEIRQMNKDGSNPHVMRGEDGGTGIDKWVDGTSLAIIRDHVYYLDGGNVAYKKIAE